MLRQLISKLRRERPAQAAEPRRVLPPSPLKECWAEYRNTFTEESIASGKHRAVKPIQAGRQTMLHAALRGAR